jgi:lysophospholipase L1-like esterase
MKRRSVLALIGSGMMVASSPAAVFGQEPSAGSYAALRNYGQWEKEIAAYEASDRQSPPPKGGALFIGSSTIRLWKTLDKDFPNHKVINRGFGGSEIVDSTHFSGRLIFPHEPRQIFLRAGGNDIHNGRTPREVAADFVGFVRVVRTRLPKAEILYIAVSPAPARWGETDKYRELNRMIRAVALDMPRVGFIDAFDVSLDPNGQAIPGRFVKDKLHFSPEGYTFLAERVRPFLTP